jgi:hypothetical protein
MIKTLALRLQGDLEQGHGDTTDNFEAVEDLVDCGAGTEFHVPTLR